MSSLRRRRGRAIACAMRIREMSRRFWIGFAAASGFVAVAAGAIGAHMLRGHTSSEDLHAFASAARYQMYHALALFAVAWLAGRKPANQSNPGSRFTALAGWAFVAGTVLFCGSLYLLGLTGSHALASLAPLGGLSFLAGWACLFIAVLRGGP